ncbi:MAG: hypothetical protein F6K19_40140 [Cyanothece sp. SIO1E1]|nr:hypothetical protein [Cyanothece sp. SIO1E1]
MLVSLDSFGGDVEAGRQVIRRHLKQLTPEHEAWMDALVVEDAQQLPMEVRGGDRK